MSAKGNFFADNPDIDFHLKKRVDMQQIYNWLTDAEREASGAKNWEEYQATWMEVLNTLGEYCGTQLANNSTAVEKQDLVLQADGEVAFPPAITENMRMFLELGGSAMGVSATYGGLSGPILIELAANEMLYRACPSTSLNAVWFSPIAHIIEKFGSEELKQEWIPKIAEGSVSGSMALTEPDNGSDLAGLRSYGEPQADGTWLVTGSKQFISNGCGEVSLVLAKNRKGAEGLKSLNLYLVPRKIDGKHNFRVTKIEDKPGLHGSATCALEFQNSKAWLLGNEGEGFMYMLHLMNEARIAVGFQGLGLMEAAYRLAKDYAEQRKSWGKPIARHELIAEKLYDMEVEVKAARSLLYQSAYYLALIQQGERKVKDPSISEDERESIKRRLAKINKRLRDWTPLVKWYCGERSFVMARTALQIHGGYGFTKEYRAEWLVRESLILSIYEGTSQIQGLMCLKDTMKDIIRNPREFAEIALGIKLKAISESDPLKRKIFKMRETFNSALITVLFKLVKENVRANLSATNTKDIMKLIKILGKDLVKFEQMGVAMLHAERICEMKALIALARCLSWDAKVDPSRTELAEYFINRAMPILVQRKAEIEAEERFVLARTDDAAYGAAK